MAAQHWHPPKRLRHLEAVSARNLLLPPADPLPRTYFSLSLPGGADGSCRPIYRSEAVCGTINPEWMPLSWTPELALAGQAESVVLAVHQVSATGDQAAALSAPRFWPADSAEGSPAPPLPPPQQQPLEVQEGSADSQALQEAPADDPPAAEEPDAGTPAAVAGKGDAAGTEPPEPSVRSPDSASAGSEAASPAAAEAGRPGAEADLAAVQGGALDGAGAAVAEPSGAAEQPSQPSTLPAGNAASGPPSLPAVATQPGTPRQQAAALASDSSGGSGGALAAAVAASLPPKAFPGKLLLVRLLDINRLHPVGEDLGALRDPLGPNSLVLELDGGLYIHPPPAVEAPSLSSVQSSPTKRALALAGERGLPPSSPAGSSSAPRRFANLLMSKLLRSTPNLQEAAEGRGESDNESEFASEASFSTRFTSHTAAREAAAAAAALTASGLAAKPLSTSDMHLHITALVSLRASVLELHGRAQALRERLEALTAERQAAREQEAQVWEAQQEAQHGRQRAQQLRQRLGQLQQEVAAGTKAATVRAQALVTTIKVMQAADRKLRDAQESLAGEQGWGRLVGLHRELVARRCLMVCQLGRIFRLGPITVKVLQAPPGGYLDERLERQWVGSGDALGSSGSRTPEGPPPEPDTISLNGSSALDTPRSYRQEVRLSIGGIELRPAVWRAAFDDTASDITMAEDEAAAVALGYVAQFVSRLAVYLDVPLRYPLCLLGSRSSILDGTLPVGTWSPDEPPKRSLFGRQEPVGERGDGGAARPSEYPLYCAVRRERPHFAVGVFLLNKDIMQLLQAHGISAGGPNQLLGNLHKLLLAAQSGLK